MKLIADSGSTKCNWVVCDSGEIIFERNTKGINPFFQTEDEISGIVQDVLSALEYEKIISVHYYGAGCASLEKKAMIHGVLKGYFREIDMEVESDLVAAARALCGNEPGIACILGTGSNSCFYDGNKIEKNILSLGYVLGDEGSGAVIGRQFISDLLKNQYPQPVSDAFFASCPTTALEIMDTVYKKPFPNRYLAQFTRFISEHIQEPDLYNLVFNAFDAFIKRNVMQYEYQTYPVYFTGSVAYHFQDILRDVCRANGLLAGEITQNPMHGLITYHR